MRRLLLVAAILANVHALAAQSDTPAERPSFSSAETLSVTAVTPPLLCTTSGTVVFDAVLSETGKVQKLELRRDIPCLTQLALKAAEEWEFSPATFAGKEIPSRMPVAVTFRPPVAFAAWVPLPALIPQTEAAVQAEFQPAEVTRADFPAFPKTGMGFGTVVLEVRLNEKGEASEIKVLRDLLLLTDKAKDAVGEWRFMPAAYNGKPVESRIVLAFVFSLPIPNSP